MEKLAQLKEENTSLKNIIAENDKIRFEMDAIDLATETLKNLSQTIKNSFGLYLNKDASELIEGITGGVYDSISIDENFNVFLNTPNRLVPIEQASSGTMDQVYLALRIAAGRLMQGRSKELPFIFDDSFVNYDSIRLRAALLWIANNVPEQIIVFLIILFVSFLGEVLKAVLPLPIPASIYGLVIMLALLVLKVVKIEQVEGASMFLIDIMPLMFIPASAGLIDIWPTLKPVLIPLLIMTVISTVLVMVVSGKVTEFVIKLDNKEQKEGK